MSTTNQDTSDIKKAAEQADAQQIDKNINNNSGDNKTDSPESLSDKEQTPFVDDSLRTDK